MAYSLHYICGYSNIHGNTGRVVIYEDDYDGETETLDLRFDSVKIKYNWNDWEEPIIGLLADFAIVNDEDNFFDLLPLMTSEERKYMVAIEELDKVPNKTFFQGFLNCKDIKQKYLQKQDIRLNASSYLSKLQYVKAPTIETLENDTFINIIMNCIDQAGVHPTGFAVRVNCSLYEIHSEMGSNQTLFNKCGIYKEVFWKNNVDRDSALDIIKKILTVFDCYLYWYDDYYYIERYADIWDESPTYVTYVSTSEYWPTDTGSTYSPGKTITDFVDLIKLETSQIIKIIPGLKQIEIDIEQQLLFNLIVNNFENYSYSTENLPIGNIRKWIFSEEDESSAYAGMEWDKFGDSFRNISRAVHRYSWIETSEIEYWRGMFTAFRVTATYDTVMTISWKFATEGNPFPYGDPDEWEVYFYWTLATNQFGNAYLVYNESADDWSVEYPWTYDSVLNVTKIPGTEFDMDNYSCEVTITIPFESFMLASDSPYAGDQIYTLGIGTEYRRRNWPHDNDNPSGNCYYGDVKIVVNSVLGDNYILGEVNTKFLNKKVINHHFCDAVNLGIKNAVYYGAENSADPDALDEKTEIWDDAHSTSDESLSLAEMKMKNKFRLYNKSRQKIESRIRANEEFYRPLSLFEDSNQQDSSGDKTPYLILTGYEYKPEKDEMKIILCEYDNIEDVNLV